MKNPHNVEPIVGTRIPVGSTFTRPIVVSNPQGLPDLAITEVRDEKIIISNGVMYQIILQANPRLCRTPMGSL